MPPFTVSLKPSRIPDGVFATVSSTRESKFTVTSVTLIGRLRNPHDEQAWVEFDRRYRGLIVGFLRGRGLQFADAEDAGQAVIAKLVKGLRSFEYDAARGGFRAYLYRCARSALADHASRQAGGARAVVMGAAHQAALAEASEDSLRDAFEREWIDHHYRIATQRYRETADERALALLDATLKGRSARVIGEELGMSEDAVHKAQQRLRDRLKKLIAEQLHDEEEHHAGAS